MKSWVSAPGVEALVTSLLGARNKAKSVTRALQTHCAYPQRSGKLRALPVLSPGLAELLSEAHQV